MMIVRVVAEGEADGAVTEVPITPLTTCRDVVECCRDPGDEPCCLVGTCLDKGKGRNTTRGEARPGPPRPAPPACF
ncbi:hypothetical protein FOCC_FOCC011116, partial [Frankliniella occidentalis]